MVARDPEGYLLDAQDWTPALAEQLAQEQGLSLTPAHWELIPLIQEFYRRFDHSPANRALARWIQQQLGPEQAKTRYLRRLFPDSPPKQLAQIAGLPRPDNCL